MLQAVMHGKAGTLQIADKEIPISWRAQFKSREDLLTAALFTRISYFSDEWMNLFFTTLFGKDLNIGAFKKRYFWPKFHLNQQNVEPDLLFSFEHKDMLIEVKPPNGGKQNFSQWRREIDAFLEHQETDVENELIFIALGNNSPFYKEWSHALKNDDKNLSIYCIEWKQVLNAVVVVQQAAGSHPLIEDCLEALALYGILRPVPQWNMLKRLIRNYPLPEKIAPLFASLPLIDKKENSMRIPAWQALAELISSQPLPMIKK